MEMGRCVKAIIIVFKKVVTRFITLAMLFLIAGLWTLSECDIFMKVSSKLTKNGYVPPGALNQQLIRRRDGTQSCRSS
jgi:hypothetical protein